MIWWLLPSNLLWNIPIKKWPCCFRERGTLLNPVYWVLICATRAVWWPGRWHWRKTLNQEWPSHPVIFETNIRKKMYYLIGEHKIRDPITSGLGKGSLTSVACNRDLRCQRKVVTGFSNYVALHLIRWMAAGIEDLEGDTLPQVLESRQWVNCGACPQDDCWTWPGKQIWTKFTTKKETVSLSL